MFSPPGCSLFFRQVTLGCYVHPVGFVVRGQVLKFPIRSKLSYVLKIAEEFVMHQGKVVQCGFVEHVPG